MIRASSSVQVVVSLDVEEDGLGRGIYPRVPPGVANVAALERLEFVTRDFGMPLTLLATYPVIMDDDCRDRLVRWRDRRGAEIGAHLHSWNTPPFHDGESSGAGMPMPPDGEKMATLRSAIVRRTGIAPVSFRMGRFAVGESLFDAAQRAGFRREASVVPFHETSVGSAAYAVPPDPFCVRPATDACGSLWEIPLTNLPTWPAVGRWMATAPAGSRRSSRRILQRIGVVGLHPAWFSLPAMCWAARLQVARGGRVLHVFLHSSDLAAGCTPAVRTERAVQRQLDRLAAFLRWLRRNVSVEGTTLGALRLE